MDDYAKLIGMLEEKPELRQYLFIRAFLLTDKVLDLDSFPFYGNWNYVKLGRYYAYTHNTLKLHYVKKTVDKEDRFFILFGHAYNPFSMEWEEEAILERIAQAYGSPDYMDRIDELTGIFVFCVLKGSQLEFLTDPAGIQSACWTSIGGSFYLSSHPQLVGDLCNLKMGSLQKELVNYKWYYRIMGPYLPADMTPFDQVKRVVPDTYYSYSEGKLKHQRFYPLKEAEICKSKNDYKKVITEAASILRNNMDLVIKKWDNPQISLTGGIDSNTTFAAANGFYDRIKCFSYLSAAKEEIDVKAAKQIADKFSVPHKIYYVPKQEDDLENYQEFKEIIDHNNGYVAAGRPNEYRKRVYLTQNLDADVEVKSWVSETTRGYWYKYYGRKKMPVISPKLYRNLYKIFLSNRRLAYKIDEIFEKYIEEYQYNMIPCTFPPADMHYHEIGWGSWGSLNISEMKIYSDITILYNNRRFLDFMFLVPLKMRINDKHHLALKRLLNKDLYDMNIRVVNMHETKMRAFLLNVIFTINMLLPF